jgi:His/Glu/Gln/Arg/opine family amino acid ABC transporter permease subunit
VPALIFGLGIASLTLVLAGNLAVQAVYAIYGGGISGSCRAMGILPFKKISETQVQGFLGARGVCHIVEALTSSGETVVLWTGALLGVAASIAGFGIYKRLASRRTREHAIAGAVLGLQGLGVALAILWFRSGNILTFTRNFFNLVLFRGNAAGFVTGVKNTVTLAAAGEVGGVVIGLLLAMLVLSARRTVRAPARAYINFFRGTPLLWQLSAVYFGIALGLRVNLGPFTVAIIVFALNTGAYAAEVFRAGIQSIERGQMEAARSLGMSYLQAMRYAIVPQAIRRVIPPLMNEFVILIKDTSLILVLGLQAYQFDLFSWAQNGYSATFNATFYVFAAAGYLAVTLPLIRLVNAAERRLHSGLVGIAGTAH